MNIHDSDAADSGVHATKNTTAPNQGSSNDANRDRWKPRSTKESGETTSKNAPRTNQDPAEGKDFDSADE